MNCVLNGVRVQLPLCDPHVTLLDWLRERGLTGAKEGCAEGECGACAVVLVREASATNCRYVAANSCLVFLHSIAGQEILTVEGLAAARGGELTDVQKAMAEGGGSQCGYCTPGFVMSLFAEQYRPGRGSPCDPLALSGNLCRCTGYRPIRDAALSLGPAPADALSARLRDPAPALDEVSVTGFERPLTVKRCTQILAEHPDATIVAGGTDLALDSNLFDVRFSKLVSVEAIPELRAFRDLADRVEIGAALPLSELESLWQQAPEVVREWFPLFASPLIRNRATLGGNLATASPIGDSAPLLLALGASLRTSQRVIPLDGFFLGRRRSVLVPGEFLVAVIVPKPFPAHARFFKVAKRRMDDISTMSACFALDFDESGKTQRARIAYGGVASTPVRVQEAEAALLGRPFDLEAVSEAQSLIAAALRPIDDRRGSARYRLAMALSLLDKFLREIPHAS